jgi:hypothetical protein
MSGTPNQLAPSASVILEDSFSSEYKQLAQLSDFGSRMNGDLDDVRALVKEYIL